MGGRYLLVRLHITSFCHILTRLYSSKELQLKRLMERDNISLTAAQDRMASQMPIKEKVTYADKVLDNSSGVVELERQVADLAASLRAKAGWTWRLSWLFPPLGLVFAAWSLASRALFRIHSSK